MAREEILNPESLEAERQTLDFLRPSRLEDFIGQNELKERLNIMLEAAKQRGQTLDHLLFAGPPGLGKTTLARIVANHLDTNLHITAGPVLERSGDLAAMLTRLEAGDVLFIDEIHRLSRPVEEILYPAIEEFRIDIVLGQGPSARLQSLNIEPFTLIAATTRTSLITGPLRDRFGLAERLDYYSASDLELIVSRAAKVLEIDITKEAAGEIGKRARGTPRIANRLLRRVRDFAETKTSTKKPDGKTDEKANRKTSTEIDKETAMSGLEMFGMDNIGLDKVDISILDAICNKYGGGPVGLGTLAIAVGEPAETVEFVYEPFLIQQGLLTRTPKGRMATERSWKHLGLSAPASFQQQIDL